MITMGYYSAMRSTKLHVHTAVQIDLKNTVCSEKLGTLFHRIIVI